jgi:hypothetical protein
VIGETVFAGTANGVHISTNNGSNWIQPTLNQATICFIIQGSNIFAGTWGPSVFVSSNNGVNWQQINDGMGSMGINSLTIMNEYIFAGTERHSVWRRLFSEIIGIKNINTEIPSAYSLSQNYPNPFNPTTKIKFDVPSLSFPNASIGNPVILKVYDVMGREVQTLVNERLQPGTYETTFDGSMLNSGVYFYKLITGDFTETKKMLMIK